MFYFTLFLFISLIGINSCSSEDLNLILIPNVTHIFNRADITGENINGKDPEIKCDEIASENFSCTIKCEFYNHDFPYSYYINGSRSANIALQNPNPKFCFKQLGNQTEIEVEWKNSHILGNNRKLFIDSKVNCFDCYDYHYDGDKFGCKFNNIRGQVLSVEVEYPNCENKTRFIGIFSTNKPSGVSCSTSKPSDASYSTNKLSDKCVCHESWKWILSNVVWGCFVVVLFLLLYLLMKYKPGLIVNLINRISKKKYILRRWQPETKTDSPEEDNLLTTKV